ncbi:MAG: nicotinate-nucleotide diphosphorylase (carboxylating) [Bacteroidetes bacterium QS_8_64_10]|jgi:nicotinate-nucleotide pyrophosphorylase (carboxylating)|nr:MAG: nicotinate-nucleotide diphosphorylase (carboxylating) [Bacteroidetes bacterium QS_8_64_10]
MLPPYLSHDDLDDLIERALAEDVADGDVTTLTTVESGRAARAEIQANEDGVLAGARGAGRVFAALSDHVEIAWKAEDGNAISAGAVVGVLNGPARPLLTGERLALNFLQRMSGIATATRRMAKRAKPHGAKILDTRKTAPGLRLLDKWAVRLGGGANHRLGLFDQVLIKDNHIAAAGSVGEALRQAKRYVEDRAPEMIVEIETRTLEEVRAVLDAGGADVILLDNMARRSSDGSLDVSMLREAVQLIGDRATTEASGNVTLETVEVIAATGVDAISSGALTHSVTALDLSMGFQVSGGVGERENG